MKLFRPEIPYSHQPYLFRHQGNLCMAFVAAREKLKHPTIDIEFMPWQVYIWEQASDSLTPIPMPYSVCCNPVINGSMLSLVGGHIVERGFDYRLYEYNLTDFWYPLDCREIVGTFTGFTLPFVCYQVASTEIFVTDTIYNLARCFNQIFRISPLFESDRRVLVTGTSLMTGKLQTALFDIQAMDFVGWLLNEENQHVYKSSLCSNVLAYTINIDSANFESRKIALSSYTLVQ